MEQQALFRPILNENVMHNFFCNTLIGVKTIIFLLLGVLIFSTGCRNEQPAINAHSNAKLHEFADFPFRLVWLQDLLDNKDVSAQGNHLALMGYDSEDG